jgi:hypothetical protein
VTQHLSIFIAIEEENISDITTLYGSSINKLSIKKSQKLLVHLKEIAHLNFKDICAYVKQKFNISYSIIGMGNGFMKVNFVKKTYAVSSTSNSKT